MSPTAKRQQEKQEQPGTSTGEGRTRVGQTKPTSHYALLHFGMRGLRVAPLRHAVATAAVNYSAYGRSSHSPPTQNTAYAKQQYPNNRAYRRWKNIKLTGWRQAIYVAGPFDAKNCNKISTHKKQSGKSHTKRARTHLRWSCGRHTSESRTTRSHCRRPSIFHRRRST